MANVKDWALSRQAASLPGKVADQKPPTESELREKTKSFPSVVTFEGRRYGRTGKVGTNARSGLPSAEYRNNDKGDDRVWRDSSGKVARD